MTVHLVRWSGTAEPGGGRNCLAFVDDTRVIVKRNAAAVRWICSEHGESINTPTCAHQRALAATPAAPEKRRA